MDYTEFLPHQALRSIVECYWSVRGTSTASWIVYPDTCMDILYDFGPCESFIVGTMFTQSQFQPVGYTDVFGIRFRAGGMSRLLHVPLAEFNDESPLFGDVCKVGPKAEQLGPLSLQRRVDLIDRWLMKDIVFSKSKPETWEYCLNKIVERSGNVNVYDLSREVGISQKQMERKFVEKVGPTPKQFAQLLRFRRLKEYLEVKRDKSLMEVAYDFEFTDHAHLTKFFRKFANITPSEFLKG